MSKPYLKTLTLMILIGSVLTACSSKSPGGTNDDAPLYIPSTDTHPCLGIDVAAPNVIELGNQITVRVDVHNLCDETTVYTSSMPPYSLQLVSNDDRVVWFTPSEPIPSIAVEYIVAANGTTSYKVPITIPSSSVVPGSYRIIASLFVDQDTGPDATQYVKPLRLESEPQNVNIKL